MKLPTVISQVAGTINPIILIFALCISSYNRFCSDYQLIEEMFDTIWKPFKVEVSVNSIVEESKGNKSAVKMKVHKEATQLSFFSYYFKVCGQTGDMLRSREFFRLAREFIAVKLDVRTIIDFYEKFDKLSEMTMSDEQLDELVRKRKTVIVTSN